MLHGPERVPADVQGHEDGLDSEGSDMVEQPLGEVQPGGRGGDAPCDPAVDRLIALRVGEWLADVGRQRHDAELVRPVVVRQADDP